MLEFNPTNPTVLQTFYEESYYREKFRLFNNVFSCSNPLYGHLTLLSMKLQQKERIASIWIVTHDTSSAPPSHDVEELYTFQLAKTLRPFMMGIQKVMQLIDQNKTTGDGEFYMCASIKLTMLISNMRRNWCSKQDSIIAFPSLFLNRHDIC